MERKPPLLNIQARETNPVIKLTRHLKFLKTSPEAVVLDMDGVIVDSEDAWDDLEKEMLVEHGVPEEFDLSSIMGLSQRDIYEELEEHLDMSFDRFREMYDRKAEKIYGEKVHLRQGIRDIVKNDGFKLGLCSSSPMRWIEIVLDRFDLGQQFDALVSAHNFEGPGKPEPEVYLECFRRLGVEPEDAVVLEDSDTGAEAASRAGAYVVGVRGTEEQQLSAADEVVADPSDLD